MQDGNLTLSELRSEFSAHKELVDYLFDKVTDINLQIGLPQMGAGETKSALRNTGSIDANVDIVATTATGEKLRSSAVITAQTTEKSFSRPRLRSSALRSIPKTFTRKPNISTIFSRGKPPTAIQSSPQRESLISRTLPVLKQRHGPCYEIIPSLTICG